MTVNVEAMAAVDAVSVEALRERVRLLEGIILRAYGTLRKTTDYAEGADAVEKILAEGLR